MYAPGARLWDPRRIIGFRNLAIVDNNPRLPPGSHARFSVCRTGRNRVASLGITSGPVGTSIENPDVDYAKLASSMGWWSAGPIKDPAELGPHA